MATPITQEDTWELADLIYWQVLDVLKIEDVCVEDDPDTDGSKNTEMGESLYYTIENTLQAWSEGCSK
jgi:hypothetical protein